MVSITPVVGDNISQPTDTTAYDKITYYLKIGTGTTGTARLEALPNHVETARGGTQDSWFPLPLSFNAADGSSDFEYYVDIQVSGIRQIRAVINAAAASGTISGSISGIGA